jgi:DNA-binding NtrC family response regulator
MSEPATGRHSILVVDDHRDTALVYATMLLAAGYAPVTATSLAEAKVLCRAREFDLVIADYELGDGKGTELLSAAVPHRPRAGILVTSAVRDVPALRAAAPGWSDCLYKVLTMDGLVGAVERVLGSRHAAATSAN